GFTYMTTDVADLYGERIEDDKYWPDGEQLPLESRKETFEVAGSDPEEPEEQSTHHGPLLSELEPDTALQPRNPPIDEAHDAQPHGEFAISLRWTALDVTTTPQAIFTLNQATNFGEFRQAASEFEVPGQNLIYADTDGNIGYQAPGTLPIRGAGD